MHLLNSLSASLVPVSHREFLKLLPLGELVDRGYLPAGAGVAEVARFFGVTPRALTAFRHSRAFTSSPYALAAEESVQVIAGLRLA